MRPAVLLIVEGDFRTPLANTCAVSPNEINRDAISVIRRKSFLTRCKKCQLVLLPACTICSLGSPQYPPGVKPPNLPSCMSVTGHYHQHINGVLYLSPVHLYMC